jgi:predicted nucleic acid-binding protein
VRRFLDTSVLLHADDLDAGAKRETAREILARALASAEGVLSTQVLKDFFAVSTCKLGAEPAVARRKVELLATMDLVQVDLELILAGIDLSRLHAFSLWDGMIVRAASAAGCRVLLTEDLEHGRVVDGVRIENPFR